MDVDRIYGPRMVYGPREGNPGNQILGNWSDRFFQACKWRNPKIGPPRPKPFYLRFRKMQPWRRRIMKDFAGGGYGRPLGEPWKSMRLECLDE